MTAIREAEKNERARIREIEAICEHFGVSADEYIESGRSVESVKSAIVDKLCKDNAPVQARGQADVTKDEQDKFRAAAGDALVMRSGINIEHPADGARDLMGMSLRDLAIECIQSEEGITGLNRKSNDDIYQMTARQFFSPTAAFPAILDNAINKAYLEGHKTVAVTFDRITKKGTLKDFKTVDNNYLAGPAGVVERLSRRTCVLYFFLL